MQVGRDFPKSIRFIDEKGNSHRVLVSYNWVPGRCGGCKGLGHGIEECRKVGDDKQWKPRARKPFVRKNDTLKPIPQHVPKPM